MNIDLFDIGGAVLAAIERRAMDLGPYIDAPCPHEPPRMVEASFQSYSPRIDRRGIAAMAEQIAAELPTWFPRGAFALPLPRPCDSRIVCASTQIAGLAVAVWVRTETVTPTRVLFTAALIVKRSP